VLVVPEARFVAEVDAIVSLGGDGTMLGAMRLAVDRPVPVLGVNYGNVGFLVEIVPADALVLSTPTGSTAYNYAAGAPVIAPAAEVLAVTPVAPMSGVSHSIILPARDAVVLRASDGPTAMVRVDGIGWRSLDPAVP
jgi:NAD kinase